MCNSGVNHAQLQMTIEMAQQQTVLVSNWMREISHQAGHAGLAGEELAIAEKALKAARRALEDAAETVQTGQDNNPSYEVSSV
ncbi:MAG: hypothetical protein FWE48_01590 [Coriobacteriia bacterium]|nr:hypothetical protein [Coriobacteriia bacterium]MCL2745773.1 hypothetical protein [Coriobacteriia bacterium]MCL2870210.1 hypothetical protein [Coriobacteriia bacterium]